MKINILLEKKCGLAIGIVLAVQLAGESARAGLAIPYTPDAATMHLWHLNDASGQLYAVDSATLSPDATPITLENIGEPTPGSLPTNAFFGASGPNEPGLSTCYSVTEPFSPMFPNSVIRPPALSRSKRSSTSARAMSYPQSTRRYLRVTTAMAQVGDGSGVSRTEPWSGTCKGAAQTMISSLFFRPLETTPFHLKPIAGIMWRLPLPARVQPTAIPPA